MTEIERYTSRPAEVDSWADVLPNVVKLADHIANTEFVPKGLQGKPAAVAAAILAGREQGIGPMTSLTHMHVVEGRPTMSAELKRARVLADGHEIHYEEMSTTRCVVRGRRKGSENWTTVTWTMDDAKRAKLDGKTNWRSHPRRMLQARATGELCDLLFPDVVGGLPSTEEVEDERGDYTDAASPAAPAEGKRTARRRAAPRTAPASNGTPAAEPAPAAAVPEPPLPGEEGFDDDDVKPITKAQLTKLHTVFTALAVEERDDRLHTASTIVGRDLTSSTDLTKEEASTLIDTLELVASGPDPHARLLELLGSVSKAEGGDVIDGEIVEEGS